jgi:hypothetical protein
MNMHSRVVFWILGIGWIFILLSLLLPTIFIEGADLVLTAATFIFAVIYGFEISLVIGNFSQLKTQLAIENAGILSVHYLTSIIGGKVFAETDKNIEKYLRVAIDVPLSNHLKTDTEFYAIFDPVKNMTRAEREEHAPLLESLYGAIIELPQARNQIATVAPRFVDFLVWMMLCTLATILISVLFVSRADNIFSEISAAIFATTIVGTLFLLEEIDSNKIQEKLLEQDMFNNTLASLGKERYSPPLN